MGIDAISVRDLALAMSGLALAISLAALARTVSLPWRRLTASSFTLDHYRKAMADEGRPAGEEAQP